MEPVKRSGTILERHLNELNRVETAKLKAVQDYNIMMGILEDPGEFDEEGTDDE